MVNKELSMIEGSDDPARKPAAGCAEAFLWTKRDQRLCR
jgi:hypothetical protein